MMFCQRWNWFSVRTHPFPETVSLTSVGTTTPKVDFPQDVPTLWKHLLSYDRHNRLIIFLLFRHRLGQLVSMNIPTPFCSSFDDIVLSVSFVALQECLREGKFARMIWCYFMRPRSSKTKLYCIGENRFILCFAEESLVNTGGIPRSAPLVAE